MNVSGYCILLATLWHFEEVTFGFNQFSSHGGLGLINARRVANFLPLLSQLSVFPSSISQLSAFTNQGLNYSNCYFSVEIS